VDRGKVVSPGEWLSARRDLLKKEKEFGRVREELTRARQAMPWVKVAKDYTFEGPNGREDLASLFAGRSQLLLFHFMFDPEWTEGCRRCSLHADTFDGAVEHLKQRDVTAVVVSRASLERLQTFRKRMGWRFKWVSSLNSDFNYDFHVSFRPEDVQSGNVNYNYDPKNKYRMTEASGMSVFARDGAGEIYHTYSCFSRGLENLMGIYHYLDLVPKGRDEGGQPYAMAWVRLRDQYDQPTPPRGKYE
jgi:predicted dithiol-disulfide oxidoreductase (DUF899 family)